MRRFCSSKFLLCLYVFGMTAVLAAQPPYRDGRRTTPLRTITVTSEPRAKVWIDGVFYGRTDGAGSLTIRSIASGGHTVRVRADGFKERSLPLAAIQKGEIKVPLVKTTDEAELAFQEAERLSFIDREKAVEAYRRAIRLRPTFPDAYLSMSRVLMDAGDVDAAMKAILAARRLRPGFAEASAVEGRILKESGEETKAIVAFRRAMKESVSRAMRMGAQGIRIQSSGRLGGSEIARREWYREGRVPLHTLRADIDYGTSEAKTTYGVIGIKVWVFRGEVLSRNEVPVVAPEPAAEEQRKPRRGPAKAKPDGEGDAAPAKRPARKADEPKADAAAPKAPQPSGFTSVTEPAPNPGNWRQSTVSARRPPAHAGAAARHGRSGQTSKRRARACRWRSGHSPPTRRSCRD